jgi:hypothetical protein
MSEPIYLITIGLFIFAILGIFGMRYLSVIAQAKYRAANDEAYRQLAQQAAAAQAENAVALKTMQATLDAVHTRLVSVEKVLKEVG